MRVFVVLRAEAYEGFGGPIGVFSTKEAAVLFIASKPDLIRPAYQWLTIFERTVDCPVDDEYAED